MVYRNWNSSNFLYWNEQILIIVLGKDFYLSMSWILWLPLVVYIDDTLNISKLFLWWSIYDHAYLLSCFRFDGFDTFLSFLWMLCIILDIICSILSYICILTFVTKVGFVAYYLNFKKIDFGYSSHTLLYVDLLF